MEFVSENSLKPKPVHYFTKGSIIGVFQGPKYVSVVLYFMESSISAMRADKSNISHKVQLSLLKFWQFKEEPQNKQYICSVVKLKQA